MAELPLSKFAPFTKYECRFQKEVINKLKEQNIQCQGCIYFNKSKTKINKKPTPDEEGLIAYSYEHEFPFDTKLYACSILSEGEEYVASHSLCRFFTPHEEVKENTEEELSQALQRLDFTNSNVVDNINKLRDSILNE